MSFNHQCQTKNLIRDNFVKFIGNRLSAFDKALGVNSIIQHHRKSFRRKSESSNLCAFNSYLVKFMFDL